MQTPSTLRHLRWPWAAAIVLAVQALPASAAFVPSGGGDYGGLPLYRALVFGGIDTLAATSPGYLAQDIQDGVDYASNTTPLPLATGGGTRSASGATLTGNGWTANSGFMASRNRASIVVNNVQITDDYYQLAGQGGTTRVHFDAQAPAASATFTWHVSGFSSTSGPGLAQSRLDFAATTSPGTDGGSILFGAGETAQTELGSGTFSHTVPLNGQTAQDVFLYWWTSAFTQVLHGDAPQGSSASLLADYSSTYVLAAVQLFDGLGAELDDWTMTDRDSDEVVFNAANGRLAPLADAPDIPGGQVPEPTAAALALLGLCALRLTRRRQH